MLTHATDSTIFGAKDSSLICKPDIVHAYQACTMGGNSAINAGLYFQPPSSDWDDYHPEGWHAKDVKPAIDRLLTRQPAVTDYSADGKSYSESVQTAVKDWLVGSAGYEDVSFADEPDKKTKAFGRPVYNYIDGQRGGPVRTYLQSALSRSNFHLSTGVHVQHVQQKCGKASGVVVKMADGSQKTIALTGKGRVVLSAGAILSPQVLMYSGIGPQDALTKMAAKNHTPYTRPTSWVVQENVGKGLFDNPNTFIELSSPSITAFAASYDAPNATQTDMFKDSRVGPYTFAGQAAAFWTYVDSGNGTRSGVQGTIATSGYADYTDNHTITLNVYGTSGLGSSGSVVLDDDKFIAGPSSGIYYSDPRDAKAVATFIHDIFQALPASSPDKPAENGLTPLNIRRDASVEEIQKYITTGSPYAVGAVQHWSSSCRIGKCVDVSTKVIGTRNIHVVDASIIAPMTVNPQFAVMVAGEMGSQKILEAMKA